MMNRVKSAGEREKKDWEEEGSAIESEEEEKLMKLKGKQG